jgi:3-oxoacyl-[acyl-carrier protein] reductase
MDVNLKSLFLSCKYVGRVMLNQGKGKIINISSDAYLTADAYRAHYITTKAGIIGFTRGMVRELAEYGININCVTPGFTAVERSLLTFPKEMEARIVAGQAIKRRARAEDIAGTILFLASDQSSFSTGSVFMADGGMSI